MIPRLRVPRARQIAPASKETPADPEAVLADEKTQWSTLTVDDWYGEGPRAVEVATDTAVWYHTGKPPVAIRWVLIRDPQRLQTASLVSDECGTYLCADAGLVCESLDDGSDL